jgi:hypothetical protein
MVALIWQWATVDTQARSVWVLDLGGGRQVAGDNYDKQSCRLTRVLP